MNVNPIKLTWALMVLIALAFTPAILSAQPYEIGHSSTSFTDGARGRNVTVEIYYPADNPGQNQPVSSGSFPVLVFGHGFLMTWQAYEI
jgi:predicted dienelactone hydrolase